MPEAPIGGDRLDSWKEIAAYLKRNERTVIRWERRGLPVHRVPGGQRNTVFAYKNELDAWLRQTESENDPDDKNPDDPSVQPFAAPEDSKLPVNASPEPAEKHSLVHPVLGEKQKTAPQVLSRERSTALPMWASKKVLFIGILFAIVASIAVAVSFVNLRTSIYSHTPSYKQLTIDGRPKGYLKTDGATLYFIVTDGQSGTLMSAPMSGSPMHPIDTRFSNVKLQDLSQDGKTLLFTSPEGIAYEGPLWTIPAQGGTAKPMGGAVCSVARWSPDNKKIACALNTTISMLDADGSNLRNIGSYSLPVELLTWMPDGKGLRFALYDPNRHTHSIRDVPLGKGTNSSSPAPGLPTDGTCCTDFTWMPDGKTFVYVTLDANRHTHLMTQIDGSSHEVALPTKGNNFGGLAPVKNALYLSVTGTSPGELLKFDMKQNAFQVYRPELSADYPFYSRDGKWMTYTNNVDDTLWRSRTDGSETLQLTTPPMEVEVSSWSPDGKRIAFMGREPGTHWKIYLINRDGGAIEPLADVGDNQGGPSWSPDGKSIVYANVGSEQTGDGSVRRVDLATRKVQIIGKSHNFRTARWSPDGNHIAALRWQTTDLLLFDVRTERWTTLAHSITGDNICWSHDSQFVYVDSPRQANPRLERVRISGGRRETVADLASLQQAGRAARWIGLAPDDSPIFSHLVGGSDIYELTWSTHLK